MLMALLRLCLLASASQAGTVVDDATFFSETMARYSTRGAEVAYAIYLPEGYLESAAHYPVIYLLHGSGGRVGDWLNFGDLAHAADTLIAAGELPPCIIVMPSDYLLRYTPVDIRPDAFVRVMGRELLKHIDKHYRTQPARAIGGVSFGGYMAVYLALSQPQAFRAGASLGGLFWTTEVPAFERTTLLAFFFGDAAAAARFSVYHHLRSAPDAPALFLSAGEDDGFLESTVQLYRSLKRADLSTTLYISKGEHSWATWRESAPAMLRFFGRYLR
jgi:enterochelin esterase-like enzyme